MKKSIILCCLFTTIFGLASCNQTIADKCEECIECPTIIPNEYNPLKDEYRKDVPWKTAEHKYVYVYEKETLKSFALFYFYPDYRIKNDYIMINSGETYGNIVYELGNANAIVGKITTTSDLYTIQDRICGTFNNHKTII